MKGKEMISSVRDSDDSMDLSNLIQDEEFDLEGDFCVIPKAQRNRGFQLQSSDDGSSSQQPSTSKSANDKEEVSFHMDQFVVVNFEGTMYP